MKALRVNGVFADREPPTETGALERLVSRLLPQSSAGRLLYLSFAPPPNGLASRLEVVAPEMAVDNFFLLQGRPLQRAPSLVATVGLRRSRFAPLIFWEVLHALPAGALWIDVDSEEACAPSAAFGADILDRACYRPSLDDVAVERADGCRARVLRRRAGSRAPGAAAEGWTFGLLTAGDSPIAAQMIQDILASVPEPSEIVVCGPLPSGIAVSRRVRQIDLERPEPRGWISRKKNLIVEAATFGNVCLLHDRFRFPPDFLAAMRRYGDVFGVLTFPQVYFPEASRSCFHRYADWQIVAESRRLPSMVASRIFDPTEVLYLRYDDYAPSAFACGGVYVVKKAVWNLVRQDESLYHCEWEDIAFGLDCQRAGIPHRVNPFAVFESLTPHPLALTRIDKALLADGSRRSLPQSGATQAWLKEHFPQGFKPVIGRSRQEYVERIAAQLSLIDGMAPLPSTKFDSGAGLSAIWKLVLQIIARLTPQERRGVASLFELLTRNVYNFPNCLVATWIVEYERAQDGHATLRERLRDLVVRLRAGLAPNSTGTEGLRPFVNIIRYYVEVESQLPRLFATGGPAPSAPAQPEEAVVARLRHDFVNSETVREAFFVRCGDDEVPKLQGFPSRDGRGSEESASVAIDPS